MAFVEINPKYRDLLRRQGLHEAAHFLDLPGVVISGHPDRHVMQVTLRKSGIAAFLKREHRVRWKDRLASAWAGFGLVPKSCREARVLHALRRAGIGCPEWLAAGEDDRGRAFLLVRELAGTLDLRVFLRRQVETPPRQRYRFARQLGAAVAQLHDAGFDHPDLYSKHVLVDPATEAISFLDWQRSCRGLVGWGRRCRDLAALQATLADHLARPRERLACLLAYLSCSRDAQRSAGCAARQIPEVLRRIAGEATALRRRRHIRELHQPPLGAGTQNLIWLDGEALCVTREFRGVLGDTIPDWLRHLRAGRVALPGGGTGLLQRRREFRPLACLLSSLRRRMPTAPELRHAGLLFRLQRYGIATPRLLAVGQRQHRGWVESFLLLEPLAETVSLAEWLDGHDEAQRQWLHQECLDVLQRLHEAGCHFAAGDCPLWVQHRPGETPAVVVARIENLVTRRRLSPSHLGRDLALLQNELAGHHSNSLQHVAS